MKPRPLTKTQRAQLVDAMCEYRKAHWDDELRDDAIRFGRLGYEEYADDELVDEARECDLDILKDWMLDEA